MSPGLRCLGMGLALALLVPVFAADPKTDKKDSSKEKLRPLPRLQGIPVQINRVDAGTKTLNIRVGSQNVDVVAADELKIRSSHIPTIFDDKGNVKKPTAADLAKAKGDPKLPGYTSDFDNLKPGMRVNVWLAELLDPPAITTKKKDKDAGKPDRRPRVTMIIH